MRDRDVVLERCAGPRPHPCGSLAISWSVSGAIAPRTSAMAMFERGLDVAVFDRDIEEPANAVVRALVHEEGRAGPSMPAYHALRGDAPLVSADLFWAGDLTGGTKRSRIDSLTKAS